jgi:hypothetical protein
MTEQQSGQATAPAESDAGRAVSATTVSTHFKMIFLAVFGLSAALLGVRIGVGILMQSPTEDLKDAMSTCTQLGIAGFGAILGLIGGKLS